MGMSLLSSGQISPGLASECGSKTRACLCLRITPRYNRYIRKFYQINFSLAQWSSQSTFNSRKNRFPRNRKKSFPKFWIKVTFSPISTMASNILKCACESSTAFYEPRAVFQKIRTCLWNFCRFNQIRFLLVLTVAFFSRSKIFRITIYKCLNMITSYQFSCDLSSVQYI